MRTKGIAHHFPVFVNTVQCKCSPGFIFFSAGDDKGFPLQFRCLTFCVCYVLSESADPEGSGLATVLMEVNYSFDSECNTSEINMENVIEMTDRGFS